MINNFSCCNKYLNNYFTGFLLPFFLNYFYIQGVILDLKNNEIVCTVS